ncbi:hypothetical protein C0995_006101 [Termitomyces sp. Mi166|nr:hypothetical protein C0995_006101 [Termitomyces sp. Mi166\
MKSIGNIKSNAIYNPNEARHPPPANLMDAERDSELEQYIRSKYQFRRFIDKTSKVDPSRPSTSATSNGSSRAPSAPLTSTVSSPSISTQPPQTMAPRRSTLASTVPPQLVSQPSTPQHLRQPQAQTQPSVTSSTNGNGVWTDLVSLQNSSSGSSLPLQFQTPSQPQLSSQGYQTSMVTGINPFQQQHLASNPYSQQSYPTPGLPGPSLSSVTPFSTSTALASSQQSFFSIQQPLMSTSTAQAQSNSNFFQPQPQQALQVQVPGAGQAFYATDNGQGSSFMSTPPAQGSFLSSSPAQFPSQSPGVSTTPQPHMFSTTPQPQMVPAATQSQVQSQMMFMTTPSQQFQMQQQGGLGVGSLQTQSQTPMTMGQTPFGTGHGPLQPQVTAMQPLGQFSGAFQQPFSAGGFSGGQQWGPM